MTTAPTRRGTIYILVLVSAVIVTLIGVIGLRLAHTQAAVARADAQRDEAMSLAESAVQWGIHYVMLSTDWRDGTTSGATIRTMPLGEGTLSIAIVDLDGDLGDNAQDPFTIVGTGTIGDASQSLAVTFTNGTGGPHPALEQSITVGGVLSANPNTVWPENGGTVKEQKRLNGAPLSPKVASEADPVDLPDPGLIQTWAAKGTLIPRSLHGGSISATTFSNISAPYSVTPNPSGIYVIDAEGSDLTLSGVNSTGTIVVVNLGGTLTALNSKFTMGTHGGPSLIADGHAVLEVGSIAGISEGIFYFDGTVIMNQPLFLIGIFMATGDVTINTTAFTISHSNAAVAGPPEGFVQSTGFTVLPGSWVRLVN